MEKDMAAGRVMGEFALTNLKELSAQLAGLNTISKEVLEKTMKDAANPSRAPAWVRTGIKESNAYNIKLGDLKGAVSVKANFSKRPLKIGKHTTTGVEITYKGRLLTHLHFGMTPSRMVPQGTKRNSPKRVVKATILKGKKVRLGSHVFLAPTKAGVILPWKRKGEARTPTEVIKAISVPQMIQLDGGEMNPRTWPSVQKTINTRMKARFEHYLKQGEKKIGKVKG